MFPKLRLSIVLLFTFLISMTAFAGTNPFLASADEVVSCSTDGSQLALFTICGTSDTRTFQVTDPNVQSVEWQELDTGSCGAAMQDCPNLNPTCSWNTLSTSNSFTLNDAGEYRVVLTNANSTTEVFYANSVLKQYGYYIAIRKDVSTCGY